MGGPAKTTRDLTHQNRPVRLMLHDPAPKCININCARDVCYSHTHKSGTKRWRPVCGRCHLASYGAKPLDEGVIAVKKEYCENRDGRYGYECNAHIPYPGVLELDHIDGDRCNNVPDNIQTLCKNCHSYKSHKNRDFCKNKHTKPA